LTATLPPDTADKANGRIGRIPEVQKQKGPANTGPFLDRSFDRPYSLHLIAMNKVCRINTSGSLSFHKMEN